MIAALAGIVALLCVAPVILGWTPLPSLLLPAASAAAAAAFSRIEDVEGRRWFFRIWAAAMIARWTGLLLMIVAQLRAGAIVLGPDGTQYLQRGVGLAEAGLTLPSAPLASFGTYDVGAYYLFALVISWFGDGLWTLQTANATLGALTAPLAYSLVRQVLPSRAVAVGLLVALDPISVVLAVNDLLKDPAVMLATVVAVWALAHLMHGARSTTPRAAMVGIAALALLFLHVSRSYVQFFLLVGFSAAWIWTALVMRRARPTPRQAGAVLAAFAIAEIALLPLGWPVSGYQTWRGARGVIEAVPVASAPAPAGQGPSPAIRVHETAVPSSAPRDVDRTKSFRPPQLNALQVETSEYRAYEPAPGSGGRVVSLIRKTLGPYVWILPPDWSARTLLGGDYVLYPGMLLLYALLPFVMTGLAVTLWRLVAGRSTVYLGGLALFSAAYLLLYTVVNLSYRQRTAIFPVLALFAAVGWETLRLIPRWRLGYAAYWLALAALAAAHLVARSGLT
jgi:hypothetical protein